jgi:hypothetical protein
VQTQKKPQFVTRIFQEGYAPSFGIDPGEIRDCGPVANEATGFPMNKLKAILMDEKPIAPRPSNLWEEVAQVLDCT